VDAVGLSIMSGAHMTLFPRIMDLMEKEGLTDILLTGGGIIPPADMVALKARGVGELFGPGTPTTEIVKYIENWVKERDAAKSGA
jgi:methylmalonyl-CoA mutase C-terminal domain/subunit